jgi:hypothetical protein
VERRDLPRFETEKIRRIPPVDLLGDGSREEFRRCPR